MNANEWNKLPLARLFDAIVDADAIDTLIARARSEDLGGAGDVTSAVCLPADHHGSAVVRARRAGVLAGVGLLERITQAYDPALRVQRFSRDGDLLREGDDVAVLVGPLRSILAAERVALNFLTHLSGIATLTRQYVDAVGGTGTRIYDTRKTIPGLRRLAKYAVRCGGGYCHRLGLHDAVLIKDNHLSAFRDRPLEQALATAIEAAAALPVPPAFVEVEVDTLDQLERVLRVPGVDIVLLDNMTQPALREAVAMRDRVAPGLELEASGGINLQTLREIAETGIDRIAVGAVTHSAPALDIALDLETKGDDD